MSATTVESKWHVYNRRLGLWLFMISESMIFLALLSSRFFMQGLSRPQELNQLLGLVITLVLLASSVFAYRGEVAMTHGDRAGYLRNIWTTIVLGLVFLLGVVTIEWPEALHFAPIDTGFGTLFFAITGMHAFHVFTGLIILLLVTLQAQRGHYSAENTWDVQGAVIYWHFVDIIWVFVYPTLYLVGR